MSKQNNESAHHVARHLLLGAYIDNVRVYSSSIVICFSRLNEEVRPNEVWVTVTGRIDVVAPDYLPDSSMQILPDQRGAAVYVLCQLIGADVASLSISHDGALEMSFGSSVVRLSRDDLNTEEVWSVTSDSFDPTYPHQWSVTLDDSGELSVVMPT